MELEIGVPDWFGKDNVRPFVPVDSIMPNIFLGGSQTAMNRDFLQQHNIRYVVNCTFAKRGSPNSFENDGVKYLRIELDDSPQPFLANRIINNLANVVHFMNQCKEEQASALFHCAAGESRSPSVLIGYLMMGEGMTLKEAVELVKSKRSRVFIQVIFGEKLIEKELAHRGSNSLTKEEMFALMSR